MACAAGMEELAAAVEETGLLRRGIAEQSSVGFRNSRARQLQKLPHFENKAAVGCRVAFHSATRLLGLEVAGNPV